MSKTNNVLEFVREDDFIEYYIFTKIDTEDDKQQEALLESLLTQINQLTEKYTKDYLWYKDNFNLSIRTSSSNLLLTQLENKKCLELPFLYGVAHHGDNMADEWFIVFLLREITKKIPGTIAKVYDVDGELLLIEAAEYLPSWADPETTDNRVYLYDGLVHLLSPQHSKSQNLTVQEALRIIWSRPPNPTQANLNIQHCIRSKLNVYPDNIHKNYHYATVYVPSTIATILNYKPSLISAVVRAFCNRDQTDLKRCKTMKYFPAENFIKTRVKFTKLLYAMLINSKYIPDRKSNWKLPQANAKDYKSQLLGMRITCGFEIVACSGKEPTNIEDDRYWHEYIKSLKAKGYFRGLLEGSNGYVELKNKAQEYYIEHKTSMYYNTSIGSEIIKLLENLQVNTEELKKLENNLPDKDDDDSWLNINPDELDSMLQDKYGHDNLWKVTEQSDAKTFTEKIDNFLNHNSDIRGVKVPSHDTNQSSTINSIDFDPNGYLSALDDMCYFNIPEDNWNELQTDSDDMSEYGDDDINNDNKTERNASKSINEMKAYMDKMDSELATTTIGQSFEKKSDQSIDIEMNALKNVLESYKYEFGEAGPSSNLFGQMGVHLDTKK